MMLVSVAIPAFNARAKLSSRICSRLEQAFGGEVEVIVYDEDRPMALPERWNASLSGNSRVRVIRATENGGASRARNQRLPFSTSTCSCRVSWRKSCVALLAHPQRLAAVSADAIARASDFLLRKYGAK